MGASRPSIVGFGCAFAALACHAAPFLRLLHHFAAILSLNALVGSTVAASTPGATASGETISTNAAHLNGTRTRDFRELLDWEGIDGVMIEHFGGFRTTSAEDMKADLDTLALAERKGKFVLKGWPGFNWLDKEMMARPHDELLRLARANLDFPLACFLVGARMGSFFCYSWGYVHNHGMLDAYPEFERPLGTPRGDAVWSGLSATREFEHASVWVDLQAKRARIEWKAP